LINFLYQPIKKKKVVEKVNLFFSLGKDLLTTKFLKKVSCHNLHTFLSNNQNKPNLIIRFTYKMQTVKGSHKLKIIFHYAFNSYQQCNKIHWKEESWSYHFSKGLMYLKQIVFMGPPVANRMTFFYRLGSITWK